MDLQALNPQQALAASTFEGPLLILAGAGSGKTRALTYRIANLLERGVPAWQILAITFTNKAAREMRDRVDRLSGSTAREAWILTFHACCARILRRDIEKIGYKRTFSIYDDDDQTSVIRDLLKRNNLDEKVFTPREIRGCISDSKNRYLTPDEWLKEDENEPRRKTIAGLFKQYEKRLKDANALDFDDLLIKTLELFAQHPPVLEYYRSRFRYVHVDEYQDTNHAQYLLIRMLASEHGNICVVGDDDQSIYGWRGADVRNILDFEKDFPDTKIIKLEQNYRSTPNILDAANQVIAHNTGRKEKMLWTERAEGDKIILFRATDERSEAAWVCDRMFQLHQSGVPYGHMAALYRVNAQSRVMEEMLVRAGIPYRVYGGPKFYDRKEIRDLVAYLRVLVNPSDDVSLRRIINTPRRSIGEATVAELTRCALENGYSLFTSMIEPHEALASRARKSVADFGEELMQSIAYADANSLFDTVQYVIDYFGLRAQYEKENTEESRERVA
ncbi:MAG: UvrD-helicase domain-containing protein, partial [Oscillospiraceae bacterium]|nr:UvrD-helicase domain-containing protein [Oscillospiraceae bacterium]